MTPDADLIALVDTFMAADEYEQEWLSRIVATRATTLEGIAAKARVWKELVGTSEEFDDPDDLVMRSIMADIGA